MARTKKNQPGWEARKRRTQQIIFSIIALMMILAMVIGLFARY
ncbi:MAG: hypothetical protein PHS96_13070 [Anaerolineales bacterium]|nr:hypothetical protein [Anaerolineales bacterium]